MTTKEWLCHANGSDDNGYNNEARQVDQTKTKTLRMTRPFRRHPQNAMAMVIGWGVSCDIGVGVAALPFVKQSFLGG